MRRWGMVVFFVIVACSVGFTARALTVYVDQDAIYRFINTTSATTMSVPTGWFEFAFDDSGWFEDQAPFSSNGPSTFGSDGANVDSPYDGTAPPIPSSSAEYIAWHSNYDPLIRTEFFLPAPTALTIWIAVDNGVGSYPPTPGATGMFLNGVESTATINLEGSAVRWEHVFDIPATHTFAGRNVIALQLEDHGGATGFAMVITSDDPNVNPTFTTNPPPDPPDDPTCAPPTVAYYRLDNDEAGGILFSDDFSQEPGGTPRLSLANWDLDQGNIDVVGCGAGSCIDLDGTSSALPAILESKLSFDWIAGLSYNLMLSFPSGSGYDGFTLSAGSAYSETFASGSYVFPLVIDRSFTPSVTESAPFRIEVLDAPNNSGPYLSEVQVSNDAVVSSGEPATKLEDECGLHPATVMSLPLYSDDAPVFPSANALSLEFERGPSAGDDGTEEFAVVDDASELDLAGAPLTIEAYVRLATLGKSCPQGSNDPDCFEAGGGPSSQQGNSAYLVQKKGFGNLPDGVMDYGFLVQLGNRGNGGSKENFLCKSPCSPARVEALEVHGGCSLFDGSGTCDVAWRTVFGEGPVSCFTSGASCLPCDAVAEGGGLCSNACSAAHYSGRELVYEFGDGTDAFSVVSNLEIPDTDWHFVSMAYDGGDSVRFGIDGVFETCSELGGLGHQSNTGELTIAAKTSVGATESLVRRRLDGKLDELRISAAFLAEEELLDVPEPGLTLQLVSGACFLWLAGRRRS